MELVVPVESKGVGEKTQQKVGEEIKEEVMEKQKKQEVLGEAKSWPVNVWVYVGSTTREQVIRKFGEIMADLSSKKPTTGVFHEEERGWGFAFDSAE